MKIDLSPLERRIRLTDIRRYGKALGTPLYARYGVVALGTLLLFVAIGIAVVMVGRLGLPPTATLLVMGFAAFYTVLAGVGFLAWATLLVRSVRLFHFSVANGFAFADRVTGIRRPGRAFDGGRGRERALIAGVAGEPFEMALRQPVPREGETTGRMPLQFIELTLPRTVPNILLRNKKRSAVSSLGLGLSSATLDLEGDFASTFTLYVPHGYERDALYIFTPDVMAAVIDVADRAEIELVDDKLYVYLPRGLRRDRPEVMRRLLTLVDILSDKFARQTERYADDRATAFYDAGATIGLGGSRLRGGVSVVGLAGTIAVALVSAMTIAIALSGSSVAELFGG